LDPPVPKSRDFATLNREWADRAIGALVRLAINWRASLVAFWVVYGAYLLVATVKPDVGVSLREVIIQEFAFFSIIFIAVGSVCMGERAAAYSFSPSGFLLNILVCCHLGSILLSLVGRPDLIEASIVTNVALSLAIGSLLVTRDEERIRVLRRYIGRPLLVLMVVWLSMTVSVPPVAEYRAAQMADGRRYCFFLPNARSRYDYSDVGTSLDSWTFQRIISRPDDRYMTRYHMILLIEDGAGDVHEYNWSFLRGMTFRDDVKSIVGLGPRTRCRTSPI